jgi:hypothetical protein
MLPASDIAVLVVVFPPIMACLTWLLARGWAMGVQGGTVSERTKRRQRLEFWGLLVAMYLMEVALLVYAAAKR